VANRPKLEAITTVHRRYSHVQQIIDRLTASSERIAILQEQSHVLKFS